MAYVIVLLLLIAVVWVVSGPLRRGAGVETEGDGAQGADAIQRIDLEAARDAKYREIRDTELDHQTGKLSEEDFEAIDSTLRAEAVGLLHELDALAEAGGDARDESLEQAAGPLDPET
jgi:hypothetical protein